MRYFADRAALRGRGIFLEQPLVIKFRDRPESVKVLRVGEDPETKRKMNQSLGMIRKGKGEISKSLREALTPEELVEVEAMAARTRTSVDAEAVYLTLTLAKSLEAAETWFKSRPEGDRLAKWVASDLKARFDVLRKRLDSVG